MATAEATSQELPSRSHRERSLGNVQGVGKVPASAAAGNAASRKRAGGRLAIVTELA